jgi:hypothetical protein
MNDDEVMIQAAVLIRSQAQRIAELQAERDTLQTDRDRMRAVLKTVRDDIVRHANSHDLTKVSLSLIRRPAVQAVFAAVGYA